MAQSRISRALAAASFLIAGSTLLPSPAMACTCAPYSDDEREAVAIAYVRSEAIFLGQVTAVKSRRLRPLAVRDTTFEVLFAWKAPSDQKQLVVRSVDGSIGCGYTFRRPGKYLVFAYLDPTWGVLTTSICELTRNASQAQSLIRELDKLKRLEEEFGRESDDQR